jgi:hypothetical protein
MFREYFKTVAFKPQGIMFEEHSVDELLGKKDQIASFLREMALRGDVTGLSYVIGHLVSKFKNTQFITECLLQEKDETNIAEWLAQGYQTLLQLGEAFDDPNNYTPDIYEGGQNNFFLCALLLGEFTNWKLDFGALDDITVSEDKTLVLETFIEHLFWIKNNSNQKQIAPLVSAYKKIAIQANDTDVQKRIHTAADKIYLIAKMLTEIVSSYSLYAHYFGRYFEQNRKMNLSVANIACGNAIDCPALLILADEYGIKLSIDGFDISEEDIETAMQQISFSDTHDHEVHYYAENVLLSEKLQTQKYNVILFQHPDINSREKEAFEDIVTDIIPSIRHESSIIYGCTFWNSEMKSLSPLFAAHKNTYRNFRGNEPSILHKFPVHFYSSKHGRLYTDAANQFAFYSSPTYKPLIIGQYPGSIRAKPTRRHSLSAFDSKTVLLQYSQKTKLRENDLIEKIEHDTMPTKKSGVSYKLF